MRHGVTANEPEQGHRLKQTRQRGVARRRREQQRAVAARLDVERDCREAARGVARDAVERRAVVEVTPEELLIVIMRALRLHRRRRRGRVIRGRRAQECARAAHGQVARHAQRNAARGRVRCGVGAEVQVVVVAARVARHEVDVCAAVALAAAVDDRGPAGGCVAERLGSGAVGAPSGWSSWGWGGESDRARGL